VIAVETPGAAVTPTILVVDDTPDNLALMSRLFGDLYRVKVASSGEKALRIAQADPTPNLILLDIMMPGLDGYQVCERLKADAKTAHIPVIFLTAKSDMEGEKKGLDLGAVDYIVKPISPLIVMARIRNHLNLQAMAALLRDQNKDLDARVIERTTKLEEEILVRKAAEEAACRNLAEIADQVAELQRWQKVMVDNQDRTQELKREVNELLRHLGEPIRYRSQEPDDLDRSIQDLA